MAYADRIGRDDVVIPPEESREIWQAAIEQSVALNRFPSRTMSSKQRRVSVLSSFPTAYWVTTGLKNAAKQAWEGKFIEAEELAVIVPVDEAVLDDADFDIFGEVRPRVAEAIARKFDEAIFFGTGGVPATFPQAIVDAAIAAGNMYNIGTATAAEGGLAEDINQTMALMESDGFDPRGFLAERRFRSNLRGARDTQGNRLLDVGANGDTIYTSPVDYVMAGLWPDPTALGSARLVALDFAQFVVGIRQDISMRILDQAVISDESGVVIQNLAQEDAVGLRVTFRGGWQVPNPITHSEATAANRYPASILRNSPT